MKRTWMAGFILLAVLLGALAYLYGGGQAPAGQRALESLTPQNLADIKNSFNASKNQVRVLLLLSPT